jgi:hypothetical protein
MLAWRGYKTAERGATRFFAGNAKKHLTPRGGHGTRRATINWAGAVTTTLRLVANRKNSHGALIKTSRTCGHQADPFLLTR